MGKKKKSLDPIVNLIRTFWSRNRAKRELKLPKEYLAALSDKLWRVNPTKAIVYNTLKDVWCRASEISYTKRIDDARFFKEAQMKEFEKDWNAFKDEIDDLIHVRSNQPKTT
jgi:hypothetical protein